MTLKKSLYSDPDIEKLTIDRDYTKDSYPGISLYDRRPGGELTLLKMLVEKKKKRKKQNEDNRPARS